MKYHFDLTLLLYASAFELKEIFSHPSHNVFTLSMSKYISMWISCSLVSIFPHGFIVHAHMKVYFHMDFLLKGETSANDIAEVFSVSLLISISPKSNIHTCCINKEQMSINLLLPVEGILQSSLTITCNSVCPPGVLFLAKVTIF